MGRIFIESRPTPIPWYDHTYLVYQDDLGNEFVIRGGPQYNVPSVNLRKLELDSGELDIESGVPIYASEDVRENDTPAQRGQVELDLNGRSTEEVWQEMQETATQLENAQISYGYMDDNSNSVIRTILEESGVTPVLPTNASPGSVPGWDDNLDPTPDNDSENRHWDGFDEDQRQADNPDDVGEESVNPRNVEDNMASDTNHSPSAEDAQITDNDAANAPNLLSADETFDYDADYGSTEAPTGEIELNDLEFRDWLEENHPDLSRHIDADGNLWSDPTAGNATDQGDAGVTRLAELNRELEAAREEYQEYLHPSDNDAASAPYLPSAEEAQQADNPDDAGEESMNPWNVEDNDAANADGYILPTAEEARNADNPGDGFSAVVKIYLRAA